MCQVYIFPLILYRLSVLSMLKSYWLVLIQSLSKLLCSGQKPVVLKQVCYQYPCNGGSGMLHLESNWLSERLPHLGQFLLRDMVWGRKVRHVFPHLVSNSKAKCRCKPKGEALFVCECCKALHKPSWVQRPFSVLKGTLSGVGSGFHFRSSQGAAWLVTGGGLLSIELDARFGFLNNSQFSLSWQLTQNALLLANWSFKAALADMPDCLCCPNGLEQTALHAFYYCELVCPFWSHVGEWTARIDPKHLVLINIGDVVDNVDPLYLGEKHMVFLTILAEARMVICTIWKKGLYDNTNFSHCDLIIFFRHQLKVKIRSNRKCLDCITFK